MGSRQAGVYLGINVMPNASPCLLSGGPVRTGSIFKSNLRYAILCVRLPQSELIAAGVRRRMCNLFITRIIG